MKIGYADPPYIGQSAKHYKDHPDYAGEVDHAELVERLQRDYDGWVLHTHVPGLRELLTLCDGGGLRVLAWVKPFAAFKSNVPLAYAWEPVLVSAARKPVVGGLTVPLRDYLSEPITMQRGVSGAKPERVCWWLFEAVGAEPDDQLDDMYPGSGAVARAWDTWCERVTNRPVQTGLFAEEAA